MIVRRLPPLFLALLCVGVSAAVSDEVNSTGKGYVTIQRGGAKGSNNSSAAPLHEGSPEGDFLHGAEGALRSAPLKGSPPPPTSAPPSPSPTSLYSINGGKPFFLERNPITGAVDFPAVNDYDDYLAVEDEGEGDGIDRKDFASVAGVGRPSYNAFAAQAGNHKYHHSDKVPLISGSYANTKVQGTAGAQRTRQPTSPTPTPSYYPVRTPPTVPTKVRPTGSSATPSPPPSSTSSPLPPSSSMKPVAASIAKDEGNGAALPGEPAYEYDYEYVDSYTGEDLFTTRSPSPTTLVTRSPSHHQTSSSQRLSSMHRFSSAEPTHAVPTNAIPTHAVPTNAIPTHAVPTNAIPTHSSPTTPTPAVLTSPATLISSATVRTSLPPTFSTPPKNVYNSPSTALKAATPAFKLQPPTSSPLVSRPPQPSTTTILPTVIYKEPSSVVTSMPLGTHIHIRPAAQPLGLPKQPEAPVTRSPTRPPLRLDSVANSILTADVNPYGLRAEEPFRPIFGPGEGLEEKAPPRRLTSPSPPNAPIPSESPTRLNYSPNEGTSTYFVIRPDGAPPAEKLPPPPSVRPFSVRVRDQRPSDQRPSDQRYNEQQPGDPTAAPWLHSPSGHKTHVKFPGDVENLSKGEEIKSPNRPNGRLPPPRPLRLPPGPLPSPATELRPPVLLDGPGAGWPSRHTPGTLPHAAVLPLSSLPNSPSSHGVPSHTAPTLARPKVDVAPSRLSPNGFGMGLGATRGKPSGYAADRPISAPAHRPDASAGHGLPNILPQFRPNAKSSHGHSDGNFRHPGRPAAFGGQQRPTLTERLYPPPPPPPPSRLHRHDAEQELPPAAPFPPPPPRPLMRRRTVPQGNEVATLQMMQMKRHPLVGSAAPAPPSTASTSVATSAASVASAASATSAASAAPATPDKRPVFVVYASKGDGVGDEGGVVVGTRGAHLPVPPASLRLHNKDDLLGAALGPAEPQTPLLQTAQKRGQAQVQMQTQAQVQSIHQRPLKSDFPYPLVKPDPSLDAPATRADGDAPDAASDADISYDRPSEDPEINIIPYLQDYMPFATKKPSTLGAVSVNPLLVHPEHDSKARIVTTGFHDNRVQSVHLAPSSQFPATEDESKPVLQSKVNYFASINKGADHLETSSTKRPSSQQGVVGANNSEFTVSAIMHTQPQFSQAPQKSASGEASAKPQQSPPSTHPNHRPANHSPTAATTASALNFQAPFHASVNMGAAPISQGWSVVGGDSQQKKPGTVDKAELDRADVNVAAFTSDSEEKSHSEFDFENFKPQLFGGFQPIYSLPEHSKSQRQQITTERQEKKLL